MKMWTLDQAQSVIGRVEEMLAELQMVADEAQLVASRMSTLVDHPDTQNPVSAQHHEFAQLELRRRGIQERFQDSAMRFHQQGILLKGSNLVDFPSQMGDQVVLLCYQRGEGHITHWHRQESGFSDRKPIPHIPTIEQ